MDAAAIAGRATLVATGVNEVIMAQVPAMLAGVVHGATRVEVECTGDFGAFGAELLNFLQIGVRPEDFVVADGGGQDVISRQCARLIAGLVGAGVLSETVRLEPTTATASLRVEALDKVLEPGDVNGTKETASLTLSNGMEIVVRLIGKVFETGDEEYAVAVVHAPVSAEPITLRISPLPGVACTVGIALSRVRDVIDAPAGYLRGEQLPNLRFRAPLEPAQRLAVPAAGG